MNEVQTPTKSYSIAEVSEKLGCTKHHVYLMVKYGNIEAFRIGKRAFRITDHALNDFIEKMKVRNGELRGS